MKKKPAIIWAIRLSSVALVAVLTGEISANAQQASAEQNIHSHIQANTTNGGLSNDFSSPDANGNSISSDSSDNSGSSSFSNSYGYRYHSRYTRTGGS